MIAFVKKGWSTARRQTFSLILLFLCQIVSTCIVYRFVQTIVVPIMQRYPSAEQSVAAMRVFWAEAQFELMKTPLIQPLLWFLAVLLAIHLLATPFLNAGVYYSICHAEQSGGQGNRFIQGVRRLGRAFAVVFLCRILLTFAPLWWIAPRFKLVLFAPGDAIQQLVRLLPWIVGYWAYCGLLGLLFIYLQLSIAREFAWFKGAALFVRHLPPIVAVAAILFLATGVAAVASAAASLVLAGLIALILHIAYLFLKMLFKLWAIAAQNHLWLDKAKP